VTERVGVVGAAVLRDGRVLACRRTSPPHLAGLWEFPGGKVDEGETDEQALVRELQEELGCAASVGERIGPDLPIELRGQAGSGGTAVLRIYLADLDGEPQLLDHYAHRWLSADELDEVPWIPVDAPVVAALRVRLAEGPRR
jgi:8-oxo-dGTP diphosphatase